MDGQAAVKMNAGSIQSDPTESAAQLANHSFPELVPIRIKGVGVGQRIFFGLGAIDHESDDMRIELLMKPKSAMYNEHTLTVDWTPAAGDDPTGRFVVRITEIRQHSKTRRTELREFNIPVRQEPVPLPKLEPAPLEVEALVSITDHERLKAVNEQWNIIKLFACERSSG